MSRAMSAGWSRFSILARASSSNRSAAFARSIVSLRALSAFAGHRRCVVGRVAIVILVVVWVDAPANPHPGADAGPDTPDDNRKTADEKGQPDPLLVQFATQRAV